MITIMSIEPFFDNFCDSIELDSRDENQVYILNSKGFQKFGVNYTEEDEKREAVATCLLTYIFAYIGVFGQQCRSSTGHFCNEIF